MEDLKKTCGRTIDPLKQQISYNGKTTKVRPKTFQLLLQFLNKPRQLISKEELIKAVWDDVEVSEQVLFQTIRELRGLFEGEDIITTQPRKGYIWTAEVYTTKQKKSFISQKRITLSISAAFFAVILALTHFFDKTNHIKLDGSLVILPIKSQIADNSHNWVYLGAMHQLISYLPSGEDFAVLSPEHVLTIMKEANIKKGYKPAEVERIFRVSGAKLIVESTIAGGVGDYQLKYNLYFREGLKRGVIFNSSIDGAVGNFAHLLTRYTGSTINHRESSFKSDFNNELLVRAIEKRELLEYPESNVLLSNILTEDPNNIVAIRMMAVNHISMNNLERASELLSSAHHLAKESTPNELPVIHYYNAVIEFMRADFQKSLSILEMTDKVANLTNDWLYRAYASELKGKILMKLGKFNSAADAFKTAMDKYSVIQCPVGKSQSLMSLSRVAKLAGNDSLALTYLQQANQIIEERELTFLKSDFAFVANKINLNQSL